jgi:hypothetical protein
MHGNTLPPRPDVDDETAQQIADLSNDWFDADQDAKEIIAKKIHGLIGGKIVILREKK